VAALALLSQTGPKSGCRFHCGFVAPPHCK
jgi:hypothetical protein